MSRDNVDLLQEIFNNTPVDALLAEEEYLQKEIYALQIRSSMVAKAILSKTVRHENT